MGLQHVFHSSFSIFKVFNNSFKMLWNLAHMPGGGIIFSLEEKCPAALTSLQN